MFPRMYPKRLLPLFCILGTFLGMPAAWATSFVSMSDENLLQQSPAVVSGRVLSAGPAADNTDSTDYLVQVTETLKGSVTSPVAVRVPGSYDRRGRALIVPGAPSFSAGEDVLLFLSPEGGHYRLQQFVLGAFHERTTAGGRKILQRELSEAQEFSRDGQALPQPAQDEARDPGKFRSWLRNRAQGGQADSGYWSAPATSGNETAGNDTVVKENYTTLGIPPARWFLFDDGTNVSFFANQSGQSDLSGGGFSQFVNGLQAWDADTGSNVRYVYGGKTAAHGGLETSDGVNTILFNDPNGEIDGSFSCSNGGVLAQGGYRSDGNRSFNNNTFNVITEVDIVIQNGTGCFMSGHSGKEAEEVYAHEIGHSLGLGHSCGDGLLSPCLAGSAANNALMRATPHADGRGASLQSDDKAGIAYLYPDNGMAPPAINAGGVSGGGNGAGSGGGGGGGGGSLDPAALLMLMALSLYVGCRRMQVLRA